MQDVICEKCRYPNKYGTVFCRNCGEKLPEQDFDNHPDYADKRKRQARVVHLIVTPMIIFFAVIFLGTFVPIFWSAKYADSLIPSRMLSIQGIASLIKGERGVVTGTEKQLNVILNCAMAEYIAPETGAKSTYGKSIELANKTAQTNNERARSLGGSGEDQLFEVGKSAAEVKVNSDYAIYLTIVDGKKLEFDLQNYVFSSLLGCRLRVVYAMRENKLQIDSVYYGMIPLPEGMYQKTIGNFPFDTTLKKFMQGIQRFQIEPNKEDPRIRIIFNEAK